MAVKMNRTIALPPFFKHWGTDTTVEKKSTPVNAETRLDVDTLRFIFKYTELSLIFDRSRINLKMLQENLSQLSGQKKWQTYAIINLMQFGQLDEIIVMVIKSIEFIISGLRLKKCPVTGPSRQRVGSRVLDCLKVLNLIPVKN